MYQRVSGFAVFIDICNVYQSAFFIFSKCTYCDEAHLRRILSMAGFLMYWPVLKNILPGKCMD